MTSSRNNTLIVFFEILDMSFLMASKVEILILAISPDDGAEILISFPSSVTMTLSLSELIENSIVNLPSDNSARYSLV
jgi:hypothetical protein